MKNQYALIKEFEEGATEGSAQSLFIEDDILFSYGRHFPLAVRYDTGCGKYRFMVNGDRYSPSTARHQSLCLYLGPQVPFSALAAAEINPSKVSIVDNRRDDWHEIPDPAPDEPERTRWEHTLGAAVLSHHSGFYLSSLDENEPWGMRSYFLCELPKPVESVSEAFESLMPQAVKKWKSEGKSFRRQGEWFFLPTEYETRHLPSPTYRQAPLGKTTHYVTELRLNGSPYARGIVRHLPRDRLPQHRMLRLGDTWHRTIKNLARRSWNAAGNVD